MGVPDPQQLEPTLIACAAAGDAEGMAALYEPDAVIADGGRLVSGRDAIRAYFGALLSGGFVFEAGRQYPAVVSGELALTSCRYPNGTTSSEIARRQADGSWLWIIDYPTLGK